MDSNGRQNDIKKFAISLNTGERVELVEKDLNEKCKINDIADFKNKEHIYSNGDTYYIVYSNLILIEGEKSLSTSRPDIIRVAPEITIQIGRKISELKNILSVTELPYVFNKVLQSEKGIVYELVRMSTNSLNRKTMTILKCDTSGVILSVNFNNLTSESMDKHISARLPLVQKVSFNISLEDNELQAQVKKAFLTTFKASLYASKQDAKIKIVILKPKGEMKVALQYYNEHEKNISTIAYNYLSINGRYRLVGLSKLV